MQRIRITILLIFIFNGSFAQLFPIPTTGFMERNKANKVKKVIEKMCDSSNKIIPQNCIDFFIWTFDENGNLTSETLLYQDTVFEGGDTSTGIFVSYKYDDNKIFSITENTDAGYDISYFFNYNSYGQIIKETQECPAYKIWIDYYYENGLLVKKIYSDSSYKSIDKKGIDYFEYDSVGRKISYRNTESYIKTIYEYDYKNNLEKDETIPLFGDGTKTFTHYFYEKELLVKSIYWNSTMGKESTTRFEYDEKGLIKQINESWDNVNSSIHIFTYEFY